MFYFHPGKSLFKIFTIKKALVLGGTGLTGRELIGLLLANEQYMVTALVRKPLPFSHEKLVQVQFDFDHPDTKLVVADVVFCCLGTTIKAAGSKAAFYKVDYEYVFSLAKLSHTNGARKFALVSSIGANKNSSIFYSRTKGAIEEAVAGIGFESVFIFRPSLLLGHRTTFRVREMIGKFLAKALDFAVPKKYKGIEARQVAKAMITAINSDDTGLHIFESDRIATFK